MKAMSINSQLDITLYLQKFGKYQLFTFFLATLASIYAAFPPFLHLFLSENYGYRCFIPGCDNEESHYMEPWLNDSIPMNTDNLNFKPYSSCHKYASNLSHHICDKKAYMNKEIESCSKYVFESSQDTLARKWNLLCDRQWIWDSSESMFMLGVAVGTLIAGVLSDRIGRKKTFIMFLGVLIISSTFKAFAPNFISYIAVQFFVGFSSQFSMCVYAIFFESTTTTVRTTLGIILGVTYAIGELLLALCAYYFQSWRVLMYFVSFSSFVFLIYIFILPESIIWLASQSNEDKLKKELSKLAKCNNLDIRVDTFESHPESDETFVETSIPNTTKNVNRKEEQTGSFMLLFKVGCLRKYTICQMIIWFCVSFVYFGTSLGSKSIGSNYLITFICLAAVEIPGLIVGIIAVTKFGRKPVQIILLLVGSIVCYANIFLTYHYPVVGTVLAVIGKGCMSAQWSINVLYTFELFPTVVRNTGYSTASVCARIAVIISAYIPDLAESYPPLPMIIFGSCGLIATIAMLFLPETANRPLLDSVEETNQFDRSTTVITSLYNRLVNKVPDIDC